MLLMIVHNVFLVYIIQLVSTKRNTCTTGTDFLDLQSKGANCINKVPNEEWYWDAKKLRLEWLRLAYDKWHSSHSDFTMRNPSNCQGLIQDELSQLKRVIKWAEKYSIKSLPGPLSLPGRRYRYNNNEMISGIPDCGIPMAMK